MLRMLKPFSMLGLKFTAGAIPGKKLKRKADTDANESKQRYQKKRKDRQLNEKWKIGCPWLHVVFLKTTRWHVMFVSTITGKT